MLSLLNCVGCSMWKDYLWMLQQPQEDNPLSLQKHYKATPVEPLRCIFLTCASGYSAVQGNKSGTLEEASENHSEEASGCAYLEISKFVNPPSFPPSPAIYSTLPNCMQNSHLIGLSTPSLVLGLRRTVFVA